MDRPLKSVATRRRRQVWARRVWLAGALSVAIAVPGLNYAAPSSRFRLVDDYAHQAAILERGGQLVRTGPERGLRRHILLETDRPIDVLAIGSSRGNPIGVEAVGTENFLNVAASFGTVFDVVALYAILDEADRWPERLIIQPDAWSLNADIAMRAWLEIGDDVNRGLDLLGLADAHADAMLDFDARLERWRGDLEVLTSLQGFQEHALSAAGRVIRDPRRALSIDFSTFVEDPAERVSIWGSELAYWYECFDPSEVRSRAEAFATDADDPAFAALHHGYDENDLDRLDLFDAVVAAFQSRGVEVFLLIPPLHPTTFAAMDASEARRLTLEADGLFRAMADARGVAVLGALDPAEVGFTEADFCTDAIHLRPPAMARLFEAAGWEPSR